MTERKAIVAGFVGGGMVAALMGLALGANIFTLDDGTTTRLAIDSNGATTITAAGSEPALRVDSTTSGLLPPRMTEAQRDSITLQPGLVVFNTDTNQLQAYDGADWWNLMGTPASPSPDPNTVLLLHMDSDFADSSSTGHTVTPFLGAAVSSAESKFGGGSGLFDGVDDYLDVASSTQFDFASGQDFTLEFWARGTSSTTYVNWLSRTNPGVGVKWFFRVQELNSIAWNNGAAEPTFSHTFGVDVWKHVALVRSGGMVSLYVEGIRIGAPVADATDLTTTGSILVGARFNGVSIIQHWPGYIDELRISRVARYTANFTPPTTPLN